MKTSSSKKAPLKTLRVSHPIKISPFVVPTTREEAPTGNAPMGATAHKAVTNRFPQEGGNQTSEGKRAWKPLFPMTPPKPHSVHQKRLANKQMFSKRVKHYHQWLLTDIPFKAKFGQIPSDPVRVQGPSKRPSPGHLYPVSSVKERN